MLKIVVLFADNGPSLPFTIIVPVVLQESKNNLPHASTRDLSNEIRLSGIFNSERTIMQSACLKIHFHYKHSSHSLVFLIDHLYGYSSHQKQLYYG